jgi:hypothetical protein
MANAEDVNRLTSCSLVLLGHIFLTLGNNQVGCQPKKCATWATEIFLAYDVKFKNCDF